MRRKTIREKQQTRENGQELQRPERVDWVLEKYLVTTAMHPHTTLRRLLANPKDKVEPEQQGELVYQLLCKSCGTAQKEQYMRSEKKWSQSNTKSTLTDHTTTENHLIDRESHRRRLMKEAIWILKTNAAINRDEGNYELPHVYHIQ